MARHAPAWLKDLRERTKGIGKDTPVAKWPKVDIGDLVDHNPNFWRMYYEIAPADPMLTLIHAGLLLSQGEAMRAAYILELGQHRPGIPKEVLQALRALQATAMAALKATNAMTEEGMQLFDQGDYDGAVKKYREALKLCPQNGWASYELGYTLRTQVKIARGEPLDKPGTVKANGKLYDSPEVTAAFAESRRHDPLQIMAYQGSDPEVIKALPGDRQEGHARLEDAPRKGNHAGRGISCPEGSQRGFSGGRRSRSGDFRPATHGGPPQQLRSRGLSDHRRQPSKAGAGRADRGDPYSTARRKRNGSLGVPPLDPAEPEEGQPALGSGLRLYMPDKPPAEERGKQTGACGPHPPAYQRRTILPSGRRSRTSRSSARNSTRLRMRSSASARRPARFSSSSHARLQDIRSRSCTSPKMLTRNRSRKCTRRLPRWTSCR